MLLWKGVRYETLPNMHGFVSGRQCHNSVGAIWIIWLSRPHSDVAANARVAANAQHGSFKRLCGSFNGLHFAAELSGSKIHAATDAVIFGSTDAAVCRSAGTIICKSAHAGISVQQMQPARPVATYGQMSSPYGTPAYSPPTYMAAASNQTGVAQPINIQPVMTVPSGAPVQQSAAVIQAPVMQKSSDPMATLGAQPMPGPA